MTETADVISGVSVIKRVTPIGRSQTELATIIDSGYILKNRINCFQNAAVELLEFAQFDWVINAVVLHVVRFTRCPESACTSHGVTVHIR